MKIAVSSGKGGTGKTTISVNLYFFIEKFLNKNVRLIDCDVEEPNDLLFFATAVKINSNEVFQQVPEIDTDKCNFCRKCAEWCEFNAISIVKSLGFAVVNPDLCHSCGACVEACNFGAISEHPKPLGTISHFNTGFGNGIVEGRLKVGSSMQTSLIKKVKKAVDSAEIIIYDAPPGTSCPVVETVANADFIILVTEPTPFGLHDLKIMLELLMNMRKPFGVIVNKAGLGSRDVYRFLNENNIEILGEIPFTKEYAGDYASGKILENISKEIEKIYREIIEKLELKIAVL
jgi:MinD superfamily P-loop ATPase